MRRLVVVLVASCTANTVDETETSQPLTDDACLAAADGKTVTFCHRASAADPGVTITTAVQACVNGHAHHPTDTIGPCPPAVPSCPISGPVHSSEGHAFDQVTLFFSGHDFTDGSPLYPQDPWAFFADAGLYRPLGSSVATTYLPLSCGDHDLILNNIDHESCSESPDELCFNYWAWWSGEPLTSPRTDGIEIQVVRVSGQVTTDDGAPVANASVAALTGSPPFTYVENHATTGTDGRYHLALLSGLEWEVRASVGDDHPTGLDLATQRVLVGAASQIDFTLHPGPTQCAFSGVVRTSAGVALDAIDTYHFGAYYGLTGWRFVSDEPGAYFRPTAPQLVLDHIPLVCGHQPTHEPSDALQDFYVASRQDPGRPSCATRSDQPCLEFWSVAQAVYLLEPMTEDIIIPVVDVSGTITRAGGNVAGAIVEVQAQICVDATCSSTRGVSNSAVTGADGRYRLAAVPSPVSHYTLTVTSGTDTIAVDRVVAADTVVDVAL